MRYSIVVMGQLLKILTFTFSLAFVASSAIGVSVIAGCGGGSQKKTAKPKKSRKSAAQWVKEGQRAEKADKLDKAERRYRKAIRLEPGNPKANKRLVNLLLAQNRTDDAIQVGKAFVAADEKNAAAYHLLADAQLTANEFDKAETTLSILIDRDPSDPTAFAKRAEARVRNDNLTGGADDLEAALEFDEDNIEYLVSLGSVYKQQRRPDKAKAMLEEALELDGDHARAHRILGTVYRDEIELDEALSHHLKAVRLDPESGRAYFELGITQNLRGDNVAAEEALLQATKLEPQVAINWYAYGEALRVQGRNEDAIPAYKKTLKLEPNHPKAANKLGYVLFNADKIDEAEVVLTEAVRRNPDSPDPYFNLGFVYEREKKYALAVNSLTRFVELAAKGDHNIRTAKKKIRQLSRKIKR